MRVLLHTDNHVFSGSEVTLVALATVWANEPGVDVVFSHRSSAGYDPDLDMRIKRSVVVQRLRLPDPDELKARIARHAGPFGDAVRIALNRLPLRLACLLVDLVLVDRWLEDARPDLVHVNNGGYPGAISCRAMVLAARRRGLPVVHVVNNLAVSYRARSRWWDWPVDRLVRRASTVFVTGSEYAGRTLEAVLDLPPYRRMVIANTVLGDPSSGDPAVRTSLGAAPADVVVLHAARLEARKGHRHLLDAVPYLPANVIVVLAGDGPDRAALAARIEQLGVAARVRMLGHRTDVYDLLAAADLVVLPSVGLEDFPVIIVEAMAAGRPVVASRVAGTPEQVEDGVTGKLVPRGDSAALAEALTALAVDAPLRAAMGRAARARFERDFAPEVVAGRYHALHRRVAGLDQRRSGTS